MMRRRDFLRATLVTAGAVVVGPGCGSPDEPGAGRQLSAGEGYFPQSVASGDPKPDSVILWTRVEDSAKAGTDLSLTLEVALDEGFSKLVSVNGAESLELQAKAAFDNCVKAKVKGLAAATTYYYRFIYEKDGVFYTTRVGRTRTAPAAGADVSVRFAFVSCQDYIGRYYNSYVALAQEELDFVVHLGDYIYETTGDPSFQSSNEDKRKVVFSDVKSAIELKEGDTAFYSAKSISNYRDLYRIYRGDKALQAVHEKFPMIVTWDDHEFSNDSHGATASYFGERVDEKDEARRKAANKAWFEYMPVDYRDEGFVYDEDATYADDIRIYRDFVFGKHLHLVMTDLRSYRADHVVSEAGYPGSVIIDQKALASLGVPVAQGRPYLDIDAPGNEEYKKLLVDAAKARDPEYDTARIAGKIDAEYINSVIAATMSSTPPIDETTQMMLERGFAYIHLAKTGFHSPVGSRNLVIKEVFDLYAAVKLATTGGASEDVMGKEQEDWFLSTMQGSANTWKVWGNEYCLVPFQVDLTQAAPIDAFKHKFYMNLDAWDGFRNKRSELLGKLAAVGNVVAVTGDIHGFYAGTPSVNDDITKHIVEFVGSSITSATFMQLLLSQIDADPALSSIPGVKLLAESIDGLLTDAATKINPHLAFANSDRNGFVVVEVSAQEIVAAYHMIPPIELSTDYIGKEGDLTAAISIERFKSVAGQGSLYRDFEGTWKRWDPSTLMWL